MIKVWDPLLRAFHWSLVASFAIAWLSAEEMADLHIWAGYAVTALIAFRLAWGFVGPHYARFAQFVVSPGAVIDYLRATLRGDAPRYVGHNPAGAAMVVVLLLALSVTIWSGWMMTGPQQGANDGGPVISLEGDDEEEGGIQGAEYAGPEWVEELHEGAANLTLILVVLHVGGVVFSSFKTHENLPRSMVTGFKREPEPGDVA